MVPVAAGVIDTPSPLTVNPALVGFLPASGRSSPSASGAFSASTASCRPSSPTFDDSQLRIVSAGRLALVPAATTSRPPAARRSASIASFSASWIPNWGGTDVRPTSTTSGRPFEAALLRPLTTAAGSRPSPSFPGTATIDPSLAVIDGSTAGTRSLSSSATNRRSGRWSTSTITGAGRDETKLLAQFHTRERTNPWSPTRKAASVVLGWSTVKPRSVDPALKPPEGALMSTSAPAYSVASSATAAATAARSRPPMGRSTRVTLRATTDLWDWLSAAQMTPSMATAAPRSTTATSVRRRARDQSRRPRR